MSEGPWDTQGGTVMTRALRSPLYIMQTLANGGYHSVFAPCGCHNKIPHTGRLRTAEVYFLMVSAGEKSKIKAILPLKFLGEDPSLPLPVSGSLRCSLACGCIPPMSASLVPRYFLSLSVCIQISLFFFFQISLFLWR